MQEKEKIYCRTCDYRHNADKDGPTYTWLCSLVPHTQRGYCSEETWDKDPPFRRCQEVNEFGNCGWFKQRKEMTDEHQ